MTRHPEYRVTLRHGREATHALSLQAPSPSEAKRLARLDAAETTGGEPASWRIESCEALPSARRAA